MYLDRFNQMSKAQPVVNTGSTPSTDIIDLSVNRDIGGAVTDNLFLLCEVVTAFTSGGSATLRVQYQTAPDSSGVPGAWSTIAQSDDIAVASLVQGYKFLQGLQPSGQSGSPARFVRMNYVVGTAAMTAGNITAGLTPSLQHQPVYPAGYVA